MISPEKLFLRLKMSMFSDIPVLEGEDREEKYKEIIAVFEKKNKIDQVLEREIALSLDETVLFCFPYKNRVLMSLISWTAFRPEWQSSGPAKTADRKKIESVKTLQSLHQVVPLYPEELRHIKGDIQLRLTIDAKGDVKNVQVEKSLHPYLDFSAVKALRQWKFTPLIVDGKPVPAAFPMTYTFDPLKYATDEFVSGVTYTPASDVDAILDQSAEYSRALVNAAPYFLCQEDISEKHRYMAPTEKPTLLTTRAEYEVHYLGGQKANQDVYTTYRVNFSEKMERNRLSNEYQILGKQENIRERRTPVAKARRKTGGSQTQSDERRFTVLNPFLIAAKLVAKESQPLFSYRLLENDRLMGRTANVIQALPKNGIVGFIEDAKIWIERGKGRILKIELTGIPLDGYDDVWREATAFTLLPISRITYLFGVENKGIRYPSETSVRIQYALPDPVTTIDKIIIEMAYKKYKFFSVETEYRIK